MKFDIPCRVTIDAVMSVEADDAEMAKELAEACSVGDTNVEVCEEIVEAEGVL